eukprot:g71503.t1
MKISLGKKEDGKGYLILAPGQKHGEFIQTFSLDGARTQVTLKDRSHFMRAFRSQPGDKAQWPAGSEVAVCPLCQQPVKTDGLFAVRQLTAKVGEKGKRQLVTRMMPAVLCSPCVEKLRQDTPEGKLIPADWLKQPEEKEKAGTSRSLLHTWTAQEHFVNYLSGSFLKDNANKYSQLGSKEASSVETNVLGQQSVQLVNELKRCAMCGTAEELLKGGLKLLACGRCKQEWYCSKVCQKGGWPVHKKVCKVTSVTVQSH